MADGRVSVPIARGQGAAGGEKRAPEREEEISLTVASARPVDQDRGIIRIDPDDSARLGLSVGDVVAVVGAMDRSSITYTHARLMPAFPEDRGRDLIRMDEVQCVNAGTEPGETILVRPASAREARRVRLAQADGNGRTTARERTGPLASVGALEQALENMPLTAGDDVRVRLKSGRSVTFTILETDPKGPVIVRPATRILLGQDKTTSRPRRTGARAGGTGAAYGRIGGLDRELSRVREMIELPLRRPDLFDHLGIAAPKGVLLTGPPGSGKTLIARAVADEAEATFISVNGPEIVDKFYGASEAQLREIFETARAKAPSIIFIDEIDAIAPKREDLGGERQVERRIVAQLLTLMDGLEGRGQVVVIAATNLADCLDPALRRPGRFDRELSIPVPDRHARRTILDIYAQDMPLAEDVDLGQIAECTHGYVGADLEALSREAGMGALRRYLAQQEAVDPDQSDVDSLDLSVTMDDFRHAMADIAPSAIREVFTEVPMVRWDDVGGLEAEKQLLIEAVDWPLRHEAAYAAVGLRAPRGVLLCGPPGTGKTLLAKALATETQVNFISVRGPQILSMYLGESERALRDVFRKARMAAPCILFFDEIDALVPIRGEGAGSDGQTAERVVAQFLVEMDGVDPLTGVLVLAATNRRDRIDPALLRPGRFDVIVDLPAPGADARAAILDIHLRDRPIARDVRVADLVTATDGLSGADLEGLCRQAALQALKDHLAGDARGKDLTITAAHFDRILKARALGAAEHPTGAGRP